MLLQVTRAIYLSVFHPHDLAASESEYSFAIKRGWILILMRWLYYSLIFSLFRDYQGRWAPFVPPPLGLDLATYARLQKALALAFGLLLMSAMALVLKVYLQGRGKGLPMGALLSILGISYFLPFVLLQLVDLLMLATIGWRLIPVTAAHTAVLIWESWAATQIISGLKPLSAVEKAVCMFLQVATWIALAGALWR